MGFGEGRFERFGENESIKEEIDAIWAWLIEKSHEDKTGAAAARKKLYQNLNLLGVVNGNGQIDIQQWTDFVTNQVQRKTTPIKPDNYPDYELFEKKYYELLEQKPDLKYLKRHTDNIPKYLHGLGMVMSDKIVYESIFEDDDIITKNGEIENGKHREAAREILNMCGYVKQTPWIRTSYEA